MLFSSQIIASFESCAHPLYDANRAAAALQLLDSMIAGFRLTHIDAANIINTAPTNDSQPGVNHREVTVSPRPQQGESTSSSSFPAECSCSTISIVDQNTFKSALGNPAWDPRWTPDKIWQEETRRLCWSSLKLSVMHLAFDPHSTPQINSLSLIRSSKAREIPILIYSPTEATYS